MPKISDLPVLVSLDEVNDALPIVNGGVTRKATPDQIYAPLVARTKTTHASIVTPSTFKAPQLQEPSPIANGALLTMAFTIGTDAAWRQFKIPGSYAGNASVHLHWTKSSDANEAGKNAKWRVTYKIFDGSSEDATSTTGTVEAEQAYADSGTTTRIVYRTSNLVLTGVAALKYLAVKVEAVAPSSNPMASEPALFSLDLLFDENVFG